jgi:hypothetical protein
LAGRPKGKQMLGIPGHRWNNIKVDLKQIRQEGENQIHLVGGRELCQALTNMVIKLWVSQHATNFLTSYRTIIF